MVSEVEAERGDVTRRTKEGGYQAARHGGEHLLAQRDGRVLVIVVGLGVPVEPVVALALDRHGGHYLMKIGGGRIEGGRKGRRSMEPCWR